MKDWRDRPGTGELRPPTLSASRVTSHRPISRPTAGRNHTTLTRGCRCRRGSDMADHLEGRWEGENNNRMDDKSSKKL